MPQASEQLRCEVQTAVKTSQHSKAEAQTAVAESDQMKIVVSELQESAEREWRHAQEMASVVEELREQVGGGYLLSSFRSPIVVPLSAIPISLCVSA